MEATETFLFKKSIPFLCVHIIAFIGLFYFEWSFSVWGLVLASYVLRMFGVTAGYHRYFSHRTYQTSRFFQFFLAFLAETSAQKGILWWAGHHRAHHRYSDLEKDVHSPVQRGFWYSHVGWILSNKEEDTRLSAVADLAKFPELVFLNKHFWLPPVIYAVSLFQLGGATALFWGFFVSTVLVWHGTFTINSLSHVFGSKRYETGDESRNNWLFAILTMGEGWHNNHHAYMSATRQGFFWWELDITYGILKGLSRFGIVWNLQEPRLDHLEKRRIRPIRKGEVAILTPSINRASLET